MKAIQLKGTGIEHLTSVDLPQPEPGPGEVMVKVAAVSLNALDLFYAKGLYKSTRPLPVIAVADGAGTVVATGSGVTEWKPGDKVVSHFVQQWQQGPNLPYTNHIRTGLQTQGMLAEYVCQPEYAWVAAPSSYSFAEAATLPIAGLTAWTGLINYGGLACGQTVLTQGSGGVSLFALQIAKAAGARVIATSGSDAKLERLGQMGADALINYKQYPEWHKEVRRLTNGTGVDITLDIAGGQTLMQSALSVKLNGLVGMVGFLDNTVTQVDILPLINGYVRLQGFSVGSRESFRHFIQAIELHGIRPVIDKTFPIEDTQAAYRHMYNGAYFGKIVI